MSKAVSRGQALQVSARVATQVKWDELDGNRLQNDVINLSPEEFGRRFTLFLQNGARMFIGEPSIIPIDRSRPFDPIKFLGNDWSIEEQDEHSLVLTELDLAKVRFESMFRKGETSIRGKEKLRRLKEADYIRLDAKIFQALWENQMLIPERWKEKTNNNTTYIFFDGTVLRRPDGHGSVLSLYWPDGQWHWCYYWLELDWRVNYPSAVLAGQGLSS